ncbi:MAG: hypothetical protein HXM94_00680 [Parvimonas micra]|uniref:Uncharacterized protein n=1 Tax=Parvimonas micra TaxID=33033 RepID=A0A930E2N4_9FIRM|nr:hypothetical protein [Parvimonas micra]MBF1306289.1 hypothetical protein [Parvimonas micra]
MKKLLDENNDDRSELISEISKIVEEFDLSSAKKILFDNGDSFNEFVGRFHNILNKDDVWEESIIKPLEKLYKGVQEIPDCFTSFTKFIIESKKQKANYYFSEVTYFNSLIKKQERENNTSFDYSIVNSFTSRFTDFFHCNDDENYSINEKLFKIFWGEDAKDPNRSVGGIGLSLILKNQDFKTFIFNLVSYLSEFIDFIYKKENKKFLIVEESKKQLMFSNTKIPGDLVVFKFDLESPELSLFEFSMIVKKFSSKNPEIEFTNLIKMKMDLWQESFLASVLNPGVLTFFDFMENLAPLSLLSDEDILDGLLGKKMTLLELISLLKKIKPKDRIRIKELIIPLL